ncbi:MAG: hypothetical protein WCX65_00630 [bacterium]
MKKIFLVLSAALLLSSAMIFADNMDGSGDGSDIPPFKQKAPGESLSEINKILVQGIYCGQIGQPPLKFLAENEPPTLQSLGVIPETPGPNDPIEVSALITNDPNNTLSRTIKADLYYSYDGKKTWKHVEMDGPKGGGYWQAKIPPVGVKGTLYYFFTAADNDENYYMEIPKVDLKWGAADKQEYLNTIIVTNDTINTMPADLDLLEASVAYDGEYIYLDMLVKGEISGGTLTPVSINIYSAGFYPVDLSRENPTFILMHSQLAQFFGLPVIGLLDVDRNLIERTEAEARYFSKGGSLSMRVAKSAVMLPGSKGARIIFGTARGTQCNPIRAESIDTSGFINAVFGEREIEIK